MKKFILILAVFGSGLAFANGDDSYEAADDYLAPGFEESAENASDLEENGLDGVYAHCRRKFGPAAYCDVFVTGVRYSEDVFQNLLRRTNGNKRAACGLHRQHFNREVQHSFRPVPFKKGYVFFGRNIARCGG